MRILFMSLVLACLMACGTKKLTREQAAELIKKAYPNTVDWNIYTADPQEAAKALDTKLEAEGYITIQRKQSLAEIGNPFIFFTEKSKPFLLPTPEKDKELKIQKVKLAEQHFNRVTGMQLLKNDKKAIVEYTVVYKNVSPFVPLSTLEIEPELKRKAYFALYDDGWRIVDKPDMDFLVE
ncbi:hypothetical protein SAMN04488128_1011173 [Chitinophaga eiseniae]|uniref:Uncharacterized protein n=1 Tax=Chitinophaga eiseniae TaxID=634771 RepID=A0A1T4MM85_9BACT|nr:hypothetical protein [Chitinophaga eiseniae]SJZ68073.1 hypothetical protein SAMN04488128_1011173 [Chitinophaga eiseniae]